MQSQTAGIEGKDGSTVTERRGTFSGEADCNGCFSYADGGSGKGKAGERTGNLSALGCVP